MAGSVCRQFEYSDEEDEFCVYEIEGLKRSEEIKRKERILKPMPPPRFRTMKTDQDWTDVWPAAATFKWSTVPFPIRQGFIESSVENEGVVPSKYANLELMKIPNFLHLTPGHIKKHCSALKQFCTKWPEVLKTDEKCNQYFPLESVTSDYLFAAPTLKDERARVASIKFKLSDLDLDYRARDKFIRLVGECYDRETDEVVFESDRYSIDSLFYVLFNTWVSTWQSTWKTLHCIYSLGDGLSHCVTLMGVNTVDSNTELTSMDMEDDNQNPTVTILTNETFIRTSSKNDCHRHSLFPNTVRLWNKLPAELKSSQTVDSFKRRLRQSAFDF